MASQSLQIFYIIIVLRAEVATTFGSKMVAISTLNTKTNKICELIHEAMYIFRILYNISRPNFGILLPLKGSFKEIQLFVRICLDKKISL